MSCYISSLPDHILEAIFRKLPIATLLGCRFVCKSWRHILAHPNFAKLYRGFTNLLLCIDNKGPRPSSSRSRNLYFLELEGRSISSCKNLAAVFSWSSELSSDFWVENSCKGLLCLCSDIHGSTDAYNMWILNPLTGEYIILPPYHDDQNTQYFYGCGLGFCPNTNQYKVIRIFYPRDNNTMEAEVNTLGTDEWRNIGVVPQYNVRFQYFWTTFTNVPVNGSLHWLIMEGPVVRPIRICAFDFETEKFISFGLPPIFQDDDYRWTDVGVLRDSLYICCYNLHASKFAEIWVMKEYGVDGSWTKMLVMDFGRSWSCWPYSSDFQVIEFLENGNVLLEGGRITLFLYNPETKSLVWMDMGRTQFPISAIVSKPSFASLEDVVGDCSRVYMGSLKPLTK